MTPDQRSAVLTDAQKQHFAEEDLRKRMSASMDWTTREIEKQYLSEEQAFNEPASPEDSSEVVQNVTIASNVARNPDGSYSVKPEFCGAKDV